MVACVVIIEVALGMFTTITPSAILTQAYDAPCFIRGTYYWFGLPPNSTCVLKSNVNAFPDTTITANSMGLRSPEISSPKSPDTYRALFLGDSFTMGWGVDDDAAYPHQAKRVFNTSNTKQLESINAGLVHTAIGYQYVFIKNTIDIIKPDILILGFYPFNDIYDTQFASSWSDLDAQGLPTKIISPNIFVDEHGYLRLTYTHSELYQSIPWLKNSRLMSLISGVSYTMQNKTKEQKPDSYLRICIYKPECHDLDPGKEKIKKLYQAIQNIARARNIPVLVVMHPAEFVVSKGVRLPKYGIPYTLTAEEKLHPDAEFRAFFESIGMQYLYLLPAFAAHPDEELFYYNDDHWTPRGHEVAGSAVAEKLSQLLTPQTP